MSPQSYEDICHITLVGGYAGHGASERTVLAREARSLRRTSKLLAQVALNAWPLPSTFKLPFHGLKIRYLMLLQGEHKFVDHALIDQWMQKTRP